jgi:hypothetical protein
MKSTHTYRLVLYILNAGPETAFSLPLGAVILDESNQWIDVVIFPLDPHWLQPQWRQDFLETRSTLKERLLQDRDIRNLPHLLFLNTRSPIPPGESPSIWVRRTFSRAIDKVFLDPPEAD